MLGLSNLEVLLLAQFVLGFSLVAVGIATRTFGVSQSLLSLVVVIFVPVLGTIAVGVLLMTKRIGRSIQQL